VPKSKKRAHARRPPRRRTPEVELLDALSDAVHSDRPGPVLAVAGLLLATATADGVPTSSLGEMVGTLSDPGRIETSAAALAIATLMGDADLRRRTRREIADGGLVLPRWLAELDRSEPVDRAVEITTPLRDSDDLLVGVTVPGGHPLTAVVHLDNELGAVATDGQVLQAPLEEAIALLVEGEDEDVVVGDISSADARARIAAGLSELDLGPGTLGAEEWAESRPVIEWMLSLLPEGGEGYVLRDLSDDDLGEIADRFLASPFGPAWSDDDLRPLVDDVIAAGSANGIGDPLVWSPDNVRKLLDPRLWALDRCTPSLDRAPELLRDVIRYGHAERGLRPGLTASALAAVDAATGDFVAALTELDEDDSD
jgi:hypothetical protein